MEFQGLILGCVTAFLLLFSKSTYSSEYEGKLPFMTADVEEIKGRSFDYIVVGGGASGCAMAATLSQKYSVLLVERGGSPYGNPLVEDANQVSLVTLQTDQFTSIAQQFVSEEGVTNYRGRVLGGSTAINGGFYSRATDDYIALTGWDRQLVLEAYGWVESKLVFRPQGLSPWYYAVIDALLEGGVVPFNNFTLEDVEGTKIGGTIFDEYERRHTSADLLGAGDSMRLTILLNATVKNVLFYSQRNEEKPRAHGVRFICSQGDPNDFYEVYLYPHNKSGSWGEIVLSAGALSSPQILMLSGIGPLEQLKHFNIAPFIDFAEVGQGIQDNPGVAFILNISQTLQQQPVEIPTVIGVSKDFKFIIGSLILPTSFNSTVRLVASKIASPLSRGRLELNGTDPRINPSVRFNYLTKETDLEQCVKMLVLIQKVALSKSLEKFLGRRQEGIGDGEVSSEDTLRYFCRKNVITFSHYHGGCNRGSVVGEDYRVFGVNGLRVVDGSTLLESPGTNPMATVLMLGRYQGLKMLKEREDHQWKSNS